MLVSIASPLMQPSPNGRRVGIRIVTFEACSGFTQVTAHRIAQPPKATFVARLQPSQLPNQAARQLPDQSTTIRVEPSSTDDSRLRGALPLADIVGLFNTNCSGLRQDEPWFSRLPHRMEFPSPHNSARRSLLPSVQKRTAFPGQMCLLGGREILCSTSTPWRRSMNRLPELLRIREFLSYMLLNRDYEWWALTMLHKSVRAP